MEIAEQRVISKWRNVLESKNNGTISSAEVHEWIAKESPLMLFINNQEFLSFLCSPSFQTNLAIGFLFSEGIISRKDDIKNIYLKESKGQVFITLSGKTRFDITKWQKGRTLTSGCAHGTTLKWELKRHQYKPISTSLSSPLSASQILKWMRHFEKSSWWFHETGCIHRCLLIDQHEKGIICEDIGRHNAVDKALGTGLEQNIRWKDTIIYCSGRLSSEMVLKAARAGIPIVVSRTAPTTIAVDAAQELNMTLIGFARGKRLNAYTHAYRLREE